MKPLLEIAPFFAVAVVAHVGVFALVAQGGVSAGGDGGVGQITLEGGDPGIAALVAAWERPPETAAPVEPTAEPATAMASDTLPQPHPSVAPALPALQAMTLADFPTDAIPDHTPPAAPVALMQAPEPTPDLPGLPQPADLPPPPASPETPTLAGLFDRTERVSEAPDAALPDTAPPPPLTVAQPPERSPHPPARPAPRPEPQASRPRPATTAPAQRAAGTGAQRHDGQSGQASQTSRAQADAGGLVAQWGGAVRAAVQRQQRHPAGTRAGGTVLLRLDVHSDGRLLGVALQQSSGHAALDQAALDAVRRTRIPAAPQGLDGSFRFNLPVRFRG